MDVEARINILYVRTVLYSTAVPYLSRESEYKNGWVYCLRQPHISYVIMIYSYTVVELTYIRCSRSESLLSFSERIMLILL